MHIVCEKYFNLKQIADSGQCFRIYEIEKGKFEIYAFGKLLKAKEADGAYYFDCTEVEWNKIWSEYFDFSRDYSKIAESIELYGDDHLKEAFDKGSGIRILKQDTWEMIITFLISQNNNISRIRNSIEKICDVAALSNRAFPSPDDIDPNIFLEQNLGLGYRNEYLYEMFKYAQENSDFTKRLKEMDYETAYETLLSFKGIGPKVSSCICLFGLGHVDAFPIDTHVKQLLKKYYPNGLDLKPFAGYAGIIQQYLFFYELKPKS